MRVSLRHVDESADGGSVLYYKQQQNIQWKMCVNIFVDMPFDEKNMFFVM